MLSPTDPVFASAIVGRDEIPYRLRHLLNVESGLNDGLALPVVLVLLGFIVPSGAHISILLGEVALGVVLGIGVAWLAVRIEQAPWFPVIGVYEPLEGVAIGLIVLAVSSSPTRTSS